MSLAAQLNARLGPFQIPWGQAATVFAMGPLNSCWAVRHKARDTRDILGVRVRWGTVTASGIVEARIETIDATTRKPTGTLYDAAATKALAPVAATNQLYTFDIPPTAGRIIGLEYAVLLLTTTGGTTHGLTSHNASYGLLTHLPLAVLTAADGTTRSNLAEVASAVPMTSLVYEGGIEEPLGFGMGNFNGTVEVYGTARVGIYFTLNGPAMIGGIWSAISRTGTPSDLTLKLLDSTNTVLRSGTIDANSLVAQASGTRSEALLFDPLVLTAGTYRCIAVQSDLGSIVNDRYNIQKGGMLVNGLYDPWVQTSSTDELSWVETAGSLVAMGPILDDLVPGGGGPLVGGRLAT